jgi:hypothetical protein
MNNKQWMGDCVLHRGDSIRRDIILVSYGQVCLCMRGGRCPWEIPPTLSITMPFLEVLDVTARYSLMMDGRDERCYAARTIDNSLSPAYPVVLLSVRRAFAIQVNGARSHPRFGRGT